MFRLLSGKKLKDKVRFEKIAIEFNLMSMNQMASYHVLIETYNAINLGSSEKIKAKLIPANAHSRYLRVPLFKKSSCRSFSYFASRLWNSLPMNISMDAKKATNNKSDEVRKKNVFKKDIKKWILEGVPFR